jgi:ribonuclease D
MCKYEQRSNWNQRPLKNTQIHYAVIDAFVCVILYNEIIKIKLKK